MTSEEIKGQYSMMDVINRYGYKANRAGFIPCPFHREKTASLKIYKTSYYCFGCGANGDIFSFIQELEHVEFKEAFYILGGKYPEHKKQEGKFSQRRRKQRLEYKQIALEKEKKRLSNQIKRLNKEVCLLKEIINNNLPYMNDDGEAIYPEPWCNAVNKFENALYKLEFLKEQMKEGDCKRWKNLGS